MLDKDKFYQISPYLVLVSAWSLIGYVQEDAMIYARILENSSLFTWRYNDGIDYASTTSIAWFFILKIFQICTSLSGETTLRLSSLLLALVCLNKLSNFVDGKVLLLLIGSYSFLISAVYGMETMLAIFYILYVLSLPISKFSNVFVHTTFVVIALLIRPDLIVFFSLYSLFISFDERLRILKSLLSIFFGVFIYCIICWALFGEPLPPSVMAKFISYGNSSTFFDKIKYFISFPIFLPEISILFGPISIIVNFLFFACGCYLIFCGSLDFGRKYGLLSLFIYLLCFSVINFFPWYVLPPAFVIQLLLIQYLPLRKIILAFIFLTVPLNLWKLKASEFKEEYRTHIGNQIADFYSDMGSLLLEPAGYIPYYANVFTYDTIGLASPRVHYYRSGHQVQWDEFLRIENIGMVLIRDDIGFISAENLRRYGYYKCQSFNWESYLSTVSSFKRLILILSRDYNYGLFCKEAKL